MKDGGFREKEYYKEKIIEMAGKIENPQKGELLYRMISILEVLPVCECQRISDYLSELYLSWHSIRLSIKERTAFLWPKVSWLYIFTTLASSTPLLDSLYFWYSSLSHSVRFSGRTPKASANFLSISTSTFLIFPLSYFWTVASVRPILSATSFNVKPFSFRYFLILLPIRIENWPISFYPLSLLMLSFYHNMIEK